MAVLPEFQRQGIGSLLVQKGIGILKGRNCPFIIVLGHPEYYPRFGFEHASLYGIRCQWDVPDDAFMILILYRSAMTHMSGTARYRDKFNEAV
jgi:putative acetyltransferase